MRVAVTGSEGFVGKHLVKALKDQGRDVVGFDLQLGHDLTMKAQVDKFIEGHVPTEIYHLAAISSVPASIENPGYTAETNVLGSIYVLEAAKKVGAKVLLASTGHAETNSSPYTASKLAMEAFAKLYDNVVVTRAHNHIGPGQSSEYAVANFARTVADSEKVGHNAIATSNLSSVRNFTDVRDVVKAYIEIMRKEPGTYEVASENNYTMEDVYRMLIALSPIAKEINLMVDKYAGRPPTTFEPHGQYGTIPFEQTLQDTLDYWRRII